MKLDWDVGHPIRNLRIRILVVGEDIAEGFQRLRLEISEGCLAHRVRDKFFATQGMHRRRTRALLMCFLHVPALIAAVELCNTRRVGVDRGRRGTGLSSTFNI